MQIKNQQKNRFEKIKQNNKIILEQNEEQTLIGDLKSSQMNQYLYQQQEQSKSMSSHFLNYQSFNPSNISEKKVNQLKQLMSNVTDFAGRSKQDKFNSTIQDQSNLQTINQSRALNYSGLTQFKNRRNIKTFNMSCADQSQIQNSKISFNKQKKEKLKNDVSIMNEDQMIRHIFSKSKVYKDDIMNSSDAVQLSESFFNAIIDPKFKIEIQKLYQDSINSRTQKAGIIVKLSGIQKHFQLDHNILYNNKKVSKQSYLDPLLVQENHNILQDINSGIVCQIGKFIPSVNIFKEKRFLKNQIYGKHSAQGQEVIDCDEDTLILPEWMLKELKINEGEPICLTLDKNIINYQNSLFDSAPQSIYIQPLQKYYKEIIDIKDAANFKIESTSFDKQNPIENVMDKQDILTEMNKVKEKTDEAVNFKIFQIIQQYRILKIGQIIQYKKNERVFDFKIVSVQYNEFQLQNETLQKIQDNNLDTIFINNIKDFKNIHISLNIQLKNQMFGSLQSGLTIQPNQKGKTPKKQDSVYNSPIKSHEDPEIQNNLNKLNQSLDLNLIFHQRGLDIFYMQSMIDENQKQKEKAKLVLKQKSAVTTITSINIQKDVLQDKQSNTIKSQGLRQNKKLMALQSNYSENYNSSQYPKKQNMKKRVSMFEYNSLSKIDNQNNQQFDNKLIFNSELESAAFIDEIKHEQNILIIQESDENTQYQNKQSNQLQKYQNLDSNDIIQDSQFWKNNKYIRNKAVYSAQQTTPFKEQLVQNIKNIIHEKQNSQILHKNQLKSPNRAKVIEEAQYLNLNQQFEKPNKGQVIFNMKMLGVDDCQILEMLLKNDYYSSLQDPINTIKKFEKNVYKKDQLNKRGFAQNFEIQDLIGNKATQKRLGLQSQQFYLEYDEENEQQSQSSEDIEGNQEQTIQGSRLIINLNRDQNNDLEPSLQVNKLPKDNLQQLKKVMPSTIIVSKYSARKNDNANIKQSERKHFNQIKSKNLLNQSNGKFQLDQFKKQETLSESFTGGESNELQAKLNLQRIESIKRQTLQKYNHRNIQIQTEGLIDKIFYQETDQHTILKDSRTNANSSIGFMNQNDNKLNLNEKRKNKFEQIEQVETANASIIEFSKIKTEIQVKEAEIDLDKQDIHKNKDLNQDINQPVKSKTQNNRYYGRFLSENLKKDMNTTKRASQRSESPFQVQKDILSNINDNNVDKKQVETQKESISLNQTDQKTFNQFIVLNGLKPSKKRVENYKKIKQLQSINQERDRNKLTVQEQSNQMSQMSQGSNQNKKVKQQNSIDNKIGDNYSHIDQFTFYNQIYRNNKSKHLFGMKCPKQSKFKMIAKPESSHTNASTSIMQLQSNKNQIQVKQYQNIATYDRTLSKLSSKIFWGAPDSLIQKNKHFHLHQNMQEVSENLEDIEKSVPLKVYGIQQDQFQIINNKNQQILKKTKLFDKVDVNNIDSSILYKIIQIYKQILKKFKENYISAETVLFFKFEFVNLLLNNHQYKNFKSKDKRQDSSFYKNFKNSGAMSFLHKLELMFKQIGKLNKNIKTSNSGLLNDDIQMPLEQKLNEYNTESRADIIEDQHHNNNIEKNILSADFTESRHEDENQIIADLKSSNEKVSLSNSKDNRISINEARNSLQKINMKLLENKKGRKSMIEKIFGQSQNSENSQVLVQIQNNSKEISQINKSEKIKSVNDYIEKQNIIEDDDESTVKNIVKLNQQQKSKNDEDTIIESFAEERFINFQNQIENKDQNENLIFGNQKSQSEKNLQDEHTIINESNKSQKNIFQYQKQNQNHLLSSKEIKKQSSLIDNNVFMQLQVKKQNNTSLGNSKSNYQGTTKAENDNKIQTSPSITGQNIVHSQFLTSIQRRASIKKVNHFENDQAIKRESQSILNYQQYQIGGMPYNINVLKLKQNFKKNVDIQKDKSNSPNPQIKISQIMGSSNNQIKNSTYPSLSPNDFTRNNNYSINKRKVVPIQYQIIKKKQNENDKLINDENSYSYFELQKNGDITGPNEQKEEDIISKVSFTYKTNNEVVTELSKNSPMNRIKIGKSPDDKSATLYGQSSQQERRRTKSGEDPYKSTIQLYINNSFELNQKSNYNKKQIIKNLNKKATIRLKREEQEGSGYITKTLSDSSPINDSQTDFNVELSIRRRASLTTKKQLLEQIENLLQQPLNSNVQNQFKNSQQINIVDKKLAYQNFKKKNEKQKINIQQKQQMQWRHFDQKEVIQEQLDKKIQKQKIYQQNQSNYQQKKINIRSKTIQFEIDQRHLDFGVND